MSIPNSPERIRERSASLTHSGQINTSSAIKDKDNNGTPRTFTLSNIFEQKMEVTAVDKSTEPIVRSVDLFRAGFAAYLQNGYFSDLLLVHLGKQYHVHKVKSESLENNTLFTKCNRNSTDEDHLFYFPFVSSNSSTSFLMHSFSPISLLPRSSL